MKIVELLSNVKHDGVMLERGTKAIVVHAKSDIAAASLLDGFKTAVIDASAFESLIARGVVKIVEILKPVQQSTQPQSPAAVQTAAVHNEPVSAKVESPEPPADEPAVTDEPAPTPTAEPTPAAEEPAEAVAPDADATPSPAKKSKK